MISVPKSLRLQIGIFGRTNVGKSTFLNMIAGQDVAITSDKPGTTTDVVEKTMELLPIGPVVFLDTAGLDDKSEIGHLRIKKAEAIFKRADVIVLVVTPNVWTKYEDEVIKIAKENKTPVIIAVNKIDLCSSYEKIDNENVIYCASTFAEKREEYVSDFKKLLIKLCPDDFLTPNAIAGDLVRSGGLAVLIVPIDLEAPKGRLILPQVQTIRDLLDNDAAALVVKEREYPYLLENLKTPPDLVVCDSQVVLKMAADTPLHVKCTTFSILFARLKGDLSVMAEGVKTVDNLKNHDKILIAESCSHHALEDDIGRVKIPRWLKQYTGLDLNFDVYAGRDYPENLSEYKLVIHCGSCMLTRKETLSRLEDAHKAGVPVTNYGLCISYVQGVLDRVLEPFLIKSRDSKESGV